MEAPRHKRSRCRCALGLALLFDVLGLAGLLVGGLLETDVSDLLIYLGGVAVFFSLPWWVFWHVGNLEVPPEELQDDVGLGWRSGDAWSLESWRARRLALLARAFSAHFSLPSASASVQSQAGRPRARFAASSTTTTTSSSFVLGRPGQAEKLPRPPQSQERPSDAALQRSSLLSSLPAFLGGSAKSRDRPSDAALQGSSISRPIQAETLQRPPQRRDRPSDAALQSPSLLTSLPSAGTTTPQDSLESVHFQDHATQVSSKSLDATKWSKHDNPL